MPQKTAGLIAGEISFLGYQLFESGLGEAMGTIIAYSVARLVWHFFGSKMKELIKKIKKYVIEKKVQIKQKF